jgi:hypothetical protein
MPMRSNRFSAKRQQAPFVIKTRAIQDFATGDWFYEFAFLNQVGKRSTLQLVGDEANDVRAVTKALNRKGARLRDPEAWHDMIAAAIKESAGEIVHHVEKPGWQLRKDRPAWFSFGDTIIGESPAGKRYLPPRNQNNRPHRLREVGTLEDWQRRVGDVVKYSPFATISVSAAFAAPLLRAADLGSMGIHGYGAAKRGKSVALTAGGSVIGLGREEDLENWNTTTARGLELACAFNDLMMPINEGGAIKGLRKEAYTQIREFTYAYAEGKERGRHSSWSAAGARGAGTFRGIFVATAEHSVAKYATSAGVTRDDGELCRVLDFPAICESTGSIFEQLPAGVSGTIATEQLRRACRECSGVAFPPYVEYLIRCTPAGLRKRLSDTMREFMAHVRASTLDGVTRQIAREFALLFAAGRLAHEAGVWRWDQQKHLNALAQSFQLVVAGMKPIDPLPEGIKILNSKLQDIKNGDSELTSLEGQRIACRIGSGRSAKYIVHAPTFKLWFDGPSQAEAVLGWLHSEKLLRLRRSADGLGLTGDDFDGRTLRRLNRKPERSFEFQEPFPGTSRPTTAWDRLRVGATVLAAHWDKKKQDGWWPATINKVNKAEFALKWQEPGYPPFKARPKYVAILHPDFLSSGE